MAHVRIRLGRSNAPYMHNLLLKPEPGKIMNHLNHDCLNNRKDNLRKVTPRGNATITKAKRPLSAYSPIRGNSVGRSCPSSVRVNTRGLPGDGHKSKKA